MVAHIVSPERVKPSPNTVIFVPAHDELLELDDELLELEDDELLLELCEQNWCNNSDTPKSGG